MAVREMPGNQFGQYAVDVEGKTYTLSDLTPMGQIRVARMLGPTLLRMFKDSGGEMLKVGQALRSGQSSPTDMVQAAYPALAPILEALANLSEEAVETIIRTVLVGERGRVGAMVSQGDKPGSMPAWDKERDGPAAYTDLTGLGLLTLVGHSLAREFGRVSERYAGLVAGAANQGAGA